MKTSRTTTRTIEARIARAIADAFASRGITPHLVCNVCERITDDAVSAAERK